MRQPASIEPFTPSPESQVPHPVLRAALDNLDVQLEEELIRYRRRQRLPFNPTGERKFQPQSFSSRLPARPARDGIQLPKVRDTFNLEATGEFPVGNSADRENPVKAILGERLNRSADSIPMPLPDPLWQPSSQPLAPPEALPAGIASYAQQIELSSHEPNATLQKLAQQSDRIDSQPSIAPEDYLESSEELLKSIEEEGSNLRAGRRSDLLDTLLTPLGIGSMLLLLLSSVSLGYLMMNPSTLSALFASGSPSPDVASPNRSPLTKVPTTPIAVAPPSPNLAAEEFPDLSVDTLSKTKRSANQAPAAAPSVAKPSSATPSQSASQAARTEAEAYRADAAPAVKPSELPAVAVQSAPPAPVYESAPEPIAAPPKIEPARTESPVEPSSQVAARPAPENLYYVGTDYSGDPSLQQARSAVPDAYVRNLPSGEAKVQLGAFSSKAAAQARVQELQQQGISAQVYEP